MSGLFTINLTISVSCFVLSLLGLLLVLTSRILDRVTRQFFLAFFVIFVVYGAFCLLDLMSDRLSRDHRVLIAYCTLFGVSFFSSVLMLLLTGFMLYCSGESYRRHRVMWIVLGLWLVYLGLLIFTQFDPSIYSFDANAVYHRGPWYPVLLVPPILIMLVDLIALWRRRRKLSAKQRFAFSAYLVILAASMLVQMVSYGVYSVELGITISAFLLFLYIFMDQTERYRQKERENADLMADIMLSQIQPHFLYNALGAIQSLCRTDPAEAEQAVAKFSRYLRGNMNALSQEKTIPFEQELSHTKLYLELEQLRYEDALQVRFDLGPMAFSLPPLTLQPLVENAVRHGVRKNPDGRGTVTVSTREFEDRFEIAVTDDGPGYRLDAPSSDEGAHIGISNVRKRLGMTVGGRLDLATAPGGGTVATIVLPKEG